MWKPSKFSDYTLASDRDSSVQTLAKQSLARLYTILDDGIRFAGSVAMLRVGRIVLLTVAVLVAGGTILLSFLSFARKVETFTRAGFSYDRAAGELIVTAVEPGGAAAASGLAARRPDPPRRRAARGLRRAARREPRAQALSAPPGRPPRRAGHPRDAPAGPRAQHRLELPVPGVRRIPVPADRPLHDRALEVRAGGRLPRPLPDLVRRLRAHTLGAGRCDLQGLVVRRRVLPGPAAGPAPPLLPGLPAARGAARGPRAPLPPGSRLPRGTGGAAVASRARPPARPSSG